MYSKFMTPTKDEIIQYILLSYKVEKSFSLVVCSCVVYGFAGVGEYAGYNRLTIYSTLFNKKIYDDLYVTDDKLKETLEKYLDYSVQCDL